MRYIVCMLCILFPFISYTQKFENFGQAYAFAPKQEVYLYDTANVRMAASTGAPVTDKLFPGSNVTVVAVGELLTLNHKSAPWCEVTYEKNGERRSGQVWSGQFSPRTLKNGNVLFLYSVKYGDESGNQSEITVKAYDKMVKAVVKFKVTYESSRGVHEAEMKDAARLAGIKKLIYIYFSGEACGIPTEEQYLAWDGDTLMPLRQLASVSEAGIGYVEQKYVFPWDKGGKANEIRLLEESANYDENEKLVNKKLKIARYRWVAGKGMVKIQGTH